MTTMGAVEAPTLERDAERAMAGDREAFARLVEACSGMVCSIALAIVRDVAASEDVSQDVFLRAWQRRGQLRNPASFLPWIRQLTRNRARTWLRDQARRRLAGGEEVLAALADPHPDIATALDDAEDLAAVRVAMEALPEETREVLTLYYREERSVRQVAKLLDLREEAVRKRLSRARAALRPRLLAQLGHALVRTRPGRALSLAVMAAVAAQPSSGAASSSPRTHPPAISQAAIFITSVAAAVVAIVVLSLATASPGLVRPIAQSIPSPASADAGHALQGGADTYGARQAIRGRGGARGQAGNARLEMQRAIETARAHRPAAPPFSGGLVNKTGDESEWTRRQTEALSELSRSCRELALHEDPALRGQLGVRFRITGEPDIGGLVDEIAIDEDYTTIVQPSLRECVTESLYALELDPPPVGVSIGRFLTLRL